MSRPKTVEIRGASCCANLRWKGMFVDVATDASIPKTRDGFCWCSQTMTCLGPDGRVAEKASCCQGRGCHQEL